MSQKPLTYVSQIVKTPLNVGAVGDAAVFLAPSELGGSPRPLEGGEQHWAKYAKKKNTFLVHFLDQSFAAAVSGLR